MDRIILEDLNFFAYHGVYDEETRLGQRFHVDLTIWADLSKAAESDNYDDAICYAHITRTVEEVVMGRRFKLIERLAQTIADAVLADKRIKRVAVRVHKPGAPLPIATGSVSVSIEREQS
ncbi:dihydroneopterin aldolase [Breoghania sp.]|uniref:dihydroneopterin aldolase n=1 Tax=Breoghania sp. TaxID=2065378 RepID=UPI00260C44FF|nr:dihydroneopterin aldolase [Breoghania sp.]MDJ0929928.1 dihydroneopterin aldolase [Breoghania sp.]